MRLLFAVQRKAGAEEVKNKNNATGNLRTCWDLLEYDADVPNLMTIDKAFVMNRTNASEYERSDTTPNIDDPI